MQPILIPTLTAHKSYWLSHYSTEVEPLVAYVPSTGSKEAIQSRLAEFAALAQAQINSKGAFYITKDTGFFIAAK